MAEKEIIFMITGKDVEAASNEIKDIIKEEFDYDTLIKQAPINIQNEKNKVVEPMTVAALVLALPGAILAGIEIADKIRNRKKLDNTLNKIQKRVIQKRAVSVKIINADGVIKKIETVDTVELQEGLAKKD